MRRTIVALICGAAVVTVAIVAAAIAKSREAGPATPIGTVESFLVNSVVDHDGFDACRLLTRRGLDEVHAAAPMPDTSCESAMNFAHLELGGDGIDSEAAVKQLDYRVQRSGDRVWVTAEHAGVSQTFVLRTGSPPEQNEFTPPPTPWRIDSGAAALLMRR